MSKRVFILLLFFLYIPTLPATKFHKLSFFSEDCSYAGMIFRYDSNFFSSKQNDNLPAGILIRSFKQKKTNNIYIDKLEKLATIDLQKVMMHEIMVSNNILVNGLQEIIAPVKMRDKEKIEDELLSIEQQNKLLYFKYIKQIIESLQKKSCNIDNELQKLVGIKKYCWSDIKEQISKIKENLGFRHLLLCFFVYNILF